MNLIRTICVLLSVALVSSVWAMTPPRPTTLAQRIDRASVIFIGEVRDVYLTNRDGKRISVQQASVAKNAEKWPCIESKIRLREVLKGRVQNGKGLITIREWMTPSFTYNVSEDRKKAVQDYVIQEQKRIGRTFIVFAGPLKPITWRAMVIFSSFVYETLSQKRAIQKVIKANTRKKHAVKQKKCPASTCRAL